jgi:hypothetical protein
MTTYYWKDIELLFHKITVDGREKVAFAWSATYVGTSDDGLSKEITISGGLGPVGDTFVAYDDVTKDDAINWIEASLGDKLIEYKDKLYNQLSAFYVKRWN